jgi:uncharacterized FAD-dependent dehydrogenase
MYLFNTNVTMMTATEERVIDFKKLKKIFSNNTDIMEQVMHGLIVTAHQKAPDLERFYKAGRWKELKDSTAFIESAYQHVGTDLLKNTVKNLSRLVEKEESSLDLENEIAKLKTLSSVMIKDIEYYLAN